VAPRGFCCGWLGRGNERVTTPPFFDHICPERACSRAVDALGHPCGKEAFLHVAWHDTPEGIEGGWVCVDHAKDLHAWSPLQVHEPGPDCGMPGSLWFPDENICRCPEVEGDVEAVETIAAVAGGS
jgi:hypothetical protein